MSYAKKPKLAIATVAGAIAGAMLFSASAAQAQEDISGEAVYQRYCAVCHGADGKGNGPMAAVLKPTAPDLTLISKWNQGTFPYDQVYTVIESGSEVMAHGTRQMPIWGDAFRRDAGNPMAYPRILELVFYLKSIQEE